MITIRRVCSTQEIADAWISGEVNDAAQDQIVILGRKTAQERSPPSG